MELLVGTKICCQKCKKPFTELAHKIVSGERLMSYHFVFNKKFKPVAGDIMQTPCCKVAFFERGKIYTEKGWQP